MKRIWISPPVAVVALAAVAIFCADVIGSHAASGDDVTYNINTLAGKVASVDGTAGLQIRFSAFIESEADNTQQEGSNPSPSTLVTPGTILSSSLDATSVLAPAVTVNQDTGGAPQNETAIAVDPNNAQRVVASANDYVAGTWTCQIGSTPCSAFGDGYSGTYFSNDGGATWCCASNPNGSNIGTLIPGVEHLVGGQYDAGGDPSVAFDSRGHVYYAGLGFDRTAPNNTVAVNRGTFDSSGHLSWANPVFINQTTAPSIANDKPWIAVDSRAASPFRDNVYVTWTRFIFNPHDGRYVQSPIAVAVSRNGGQTFSDPQLIVGNVLYGQGSRPVVAPDGTVYVFWDGSTRLATLDSIWVVKSTDGGRTWSSPVAISQLVDIIPVANTAFRVNSYPAADLAPNGDIYVTWDSMMSDSSSGSLCPGRTNTGCHAASLYSKSTDGGATWSTPALVFPALDASTRTATGYPVTQPSGSTLNAPAARRVDTLFPAVAVSPAGHVYMSAYAADVVSPWQRCAQVGSPGLSGNNCKTLDAFINNARLDYIVTDLTTGTTNTVTTHPINTRYFFSGTFFGDYTDIAAGSDGRFHAFWTDSNNVQSIDWYFGFEWQPGTKVHNQDVVVRSDSF